MEIIPAIMPKDFEDMREKMAQAVGHARLVQLDLMDGMFVPEKTFPFFPKDKKVLEILEKEEEGMPYWQTLDIELDLMIKNADKQMDMILSFGPKRIIFHIEALNDPKTFLESLDPYVQENIEIGIALNNDTSLEVIKPLIPLVSFVQCMGIEHIGFQGEPFDERVLERISELRKEFPDLVISVDGSVNKHTILKLRDVGVTRFVIGSALFGTGDVQTALTEFKSMIYS